MGVGSIGESILPYEEIDTFISIDAGVTWQMASGLTRRTQVAAWRRGEHPGGGE